MSPLKLPKINIFGRISNNEKTQINIRPQIKLTYPEDTVSIKKSDSLEDILKYNLQIREVLNPLTGFPLYAKNDIPYQKEHFYTSLDEKQVESLERKGILPLNDNFKEISYFDKGAILACHAGQIGGDYILETTKDNITYQDEDTAYADKLTSTNNNFRIWHRIYGTNSYSIFFDNMSDIINSNKEFRIY